MSDPKDDYRTTLHAYGFRRNKRGKLTHPVLVKWYRKHKKEIDAYVESRTGPPDGAEGMEGG